MQKFLLVLCPFCGKPQLSTAKKRFRCVLCGRSREMRQRGGLPSVQVLREFYDGREASAYIAEYKRLKGLS